MKKLFYDTNALIEIGELALREEFYLSRVTLREIEHIKNDRNKDVDVKIKAQRISRMIMSKENRGKFHIVS